MGANNAEIAIQLDRLADLLEIEQANPFRVRAYRNAARVVSGLSQDVSQMLAAGADLADLPGIGEDLAGKIAQLSRTGRLPLLHQLERMSPPGLVDLLALPGLGPARVRALHQRLRVNNPADLERAIETGRISKLGGIGDKTIEKLRAALAARRKGAKPDRISWFKADDTARRLVAHLRGADGLTQVTVAGSHRRRAETVGDLDLLATAPKAAPVMRRLVNFPDVATVIAEGRTRAAVRLQSGLQVDLRVVPAESYGAALHYFTGSKAHNLAIRRRAITRGLKVNEYGVFRGSRRVAGRTEAEVYAAVGLPYIEPELRENRGEIEAADKGLLPKLITRADLKGDLHVHSAASDGTATIEAMTEAARAAGLSYIAIGDHTQRLKVAHGLDVRRLRRQMAAIDALNARLAGFTVLKSAEVDILPDGTLDLPDGILRELDLVICAVHTAFQLSRDRQTERILKALDHPCCHILAHPSGRLIGMRPAYDVDMDAILNRAKTRGVALELNSQPDRLDLDDIRCRAAKESGILLSIASDSHAPNQFSFLDLGVAQARRGWIEAADVINTRPLATLRKMIRATVAA